MEGKHDRQVRSEILPRKLRNEVTCGFSPNKSFLNAMGRTGNALSSYLLGGFFECIIALTPSV
jgi:hypothetical protein